MQHKVPVVQNHHRTAYILLVVLHNLEYLRLIGVYL
ncbi:hypothetical protein [Aliivibrio logei]